MKSLRIDIVKDPSDFPYYRVGYGQTKFNFAKMDDVCEFVKRHLTVDTDCPVPKGNGAQKEKLPMKTGVASPKEAHRPTYQYFNKKVIEAFLTLGDGAEGISYEEVKNVTGVHYSTVHKAALHLEKVGKLVRANPGHHPIRWKKVGVDELSR